MSRAVLLVVLLAGLAAAAGGCSAGSAGPAGPAGGDGGPVRVERVVDGDTLVVDGDERVRLIGIDTPESVKPATPVECFAREASAEMERLVEGRRVRLVLDVEQRDQYGRLLAYVYRGDVFVNLEMVRRGYATVATFPPNVRHVADFLRAQRQARAGGRGLWGAC